MPWPLNNMELLVEAAGCDLLDSHGALMVTMQRPDVAIVSPCTIAHHFVSHPKSAVCSTDNCFVDDGSTPAVNFIQQPGSGSKDLRQQDSDQ